MNPANRVYLENLRIAEEMRARDGDLIARWRADYRARTGEEAPCSDRTALTLARMASSVGRL